MVTSKNNIAVCIGIGLFTCWLTSAQNSFRNFGNLKLFENSELGFQTNLVNDGAFDDNKGRVGFYGAQSLTISGAFAPQFYNVELFMEENLVLESPIRIVNETSFFSGNIKTNKSNSALFTEFTENAFYQGASDLTKADGYVLVKNQKEFLFPIGDKRSLRPLHLSFEEDIHLAKSAYFFENPDRPTTLNTEYDTRKMDNTLLAISPNEFWYLETTGSVNISLSWNPESALPSFLEKIDRITISGWNETNKRWEDLGRLTFEGNFDEGNISSRFFDASTYHIFTFASLFNINEDLPTNYLVTANGDGVNDRLVIPELERSPNNLIQIYNRSGLKVFEKRNYTDQFNGFSTTNNMVIDRDEGLTEGIYYYFVKLFDLNIESQGFLYLTN